MLKRILAGLVVAVVMAGAASAEPLEDAVAAYDRGDFATARQLLQPLAEQGNVIANYNLAELYTSERHGVAPNLDQAVLLYLCAAAAGLAEAQMAVGLYYESFLSSVPAAVIWYRRAAEQGEPKAQEALGFIYFSGGEGVPRDYVQAYLWLALSASGSVALLKNGLAAFYPIVAARMTPDQITEAQRLVREWKPNTQRRWASSCCAKPDDP
jgi:TPR repeat protein